MKPMLLHHRDTATAPRWLSLCAVWRCNKIYGLDRDYQ